MSLLIVKGVIFLRFSVWVVQYLILRAGLFKSLLMLIVRELSRSVVFLAGVSLILLPFSKVLTALMPLNMLSLPLVSSSIRGLNVSSHWFCLLFL